MAYVLGTSENTAIPLAARSGEQGTARLEPDEAAWIEVIQQMDRVYGELVDSQVALEKKNEELEDTQDFIAGVMGAMTDLMIACDTDGNIQQVNKALEDLTGIAADGLIGRPLGDVLRGANPDMQAEFQSHIAANRPFLDCEVMVQGTESAQVPLSVNCSPRRDHRNRLVGMVLIGRPMGELQRAYRKLDDALKNFEQAQQHLISSEKMAALGRLVAGVAHELNNPISFVFGNMHALKSYGERITSFLQATDRDLAHDDMQRLRHDLQIDRIAKDILPLVEGTLEGAERVRDIVKDLRRFSGTQAEPVEEFSLRTVIETAVNWVSRGAKKPTRIEIDCPASLNIQSKRGDIHQILVNLIQNANDALAGVDQPRIDIAVQQTDGRVAITVSDNGPGISQADLGKVFEPFFTTKPVGQGTGLGLYVSYRMADEIHARLTVENRPGSGACFTLNLPDALSAPAP